MAIKVGEFFVDLVVDAASGNLSVRNLITTLGELEVTSLGSSIGIAKVANAFADLAGRSIDAATELSILAELTGKPTSELQQWQKAFELMLVPASAVGSAVRGVQSAMRDINVGNMRLEIDERYTYTDEKGDTLTEESKSETTLTQSSEFTRHDIDTTVTNNMFGWLIKAGVKVEFGKGIIGCLYFPKRD